MWRELHRCNYLGLTPAGCKREAHTNKAKADNHVPSADTRDRILSLGDIEGHDPEKAYQEARDHRRSQPCGALLWCVWGIDNNLCLMGVFFDDLLAELGFRHT